MGRQVKPSTTTYKSGIVHLASARSIATEAIGPRRPTFAKGIVDGVSRR
jgi:hypothetical protein